MTDRLWPDAHVERWLADRHSTMIHELAAFLDVEAGLRETMISARYTELLADLGDVFDIVASPMAVANVAASDPGNEIDSRAALATKAAPARTLSRPPMARRPRPPRRWGIAELATFVIVIVVLFGLAGGLPRDSTVSRFGSVPTGPVSFGYVRLAHLSPDTPKVDIYLSKVGDGGLKRKRFTELGYGVMSSYLQLAVGSYAVSMRPAGAPESDPPVLMTQVTVEDGAAHTVAVVGHFANPGLTTLTDDLTRPDADEAKVRIIQASIGAPVLDVTLPDGTAIARDVQFATTTPYQLVSPGTLKLQLEPSGSGSKSTVSAVFNAGSIYSLLVLDGHKGLKAEITPDVHGITVVPRGTVMVGAGGTARRSLGSVAYMGLLAVLILALALALGPLARLTRAAVDRRARRDDVSMIWPRRRRRRLAGRGLELAGWTSSLAALVVLAAAVVASTLPQWPEPPATAVVRLPDCQFSACEPVGAPAGYPTRVRIPSIRVDSSLEVLGRDSAGALQPPRSYERAGWFGEGVIPGDAGPAVIAGHVDSSNGRAVFYDLHQLHAGDAIDVLRDGEWITFRVTAAEQHPASKFPTDQVYRPTPGAELRLITCGGAFDRKTLSYRDVIVVYAVLVASDNE